MGYSDKGDPSTTRERMIRLSRYALIPILTVKVLAVVATPSSVHSADLAPAPASTTSSETVPGSMSAPKAAPQLTPQPQPQKAPPRDPLSGFRDLASDLWTRGPSPDTGMVLEYQLNRRGNACTGHEPEVRLRLSGDGRLEMIRTSSFAESERSGPGSFAGRIGKKTWDSVFAQVSGMEWETALPGLPMPGMSEANQVIMLQQAGRTARFDFTGSIPPGHDRIADGLSAVTAMIRDAAADTLWSLRLGAEEGKFRKGQLRVRAVWLLRGKTPLRFRLPVAGQGSDCGTLGLRWMLQPKDVQGFTAVPSERNWTYPKGELKREAKNPAKVEAIGPGTWQDLLPGDSISVYADFPAPKPKNSARVEREGNLVHMGIPVALAGSDDTLAVVTLFSRYFRF